jgi:hypothetical protein
MKIGSASLSAKNRCPDCGNLYIGQDYLAGREEYKHFLNDSGFPESVNKLGFDGLMNLGAGLTKQVALFTPWSAQRSWVWMGQFGIIGGRIVCSWRNARTAQQHLGHWQLQMV